LASLPANASEAEMSRAIGVLLPELLRARNQDVPLIAETLAALRQQTAAVPALARQYQALPPAAFEQRLLTLGLVGELRRPDATPLLGDVLWAPLPAKREMPEGLSERDLEEMIQVKAVQGLAFLATAEADEIVKEAMLAHESTHVRISAIDAFLWNHGDRPEVAKQLYQLLPATLHPFVERPRFHAGVDPLEFAARLAAWRAKLSGSPPPGSETP
jgi:hypothetical protein